MTFFGTEKFSRHEFVFVVVVVIVGGGDSGDDGGKSIEHWYTSADQNRFKTNIKLINKTTTSSGLSFSSFCYLFFSFIPLHCIVFACVVAVVGVLS